METLERQELYCHDCNQYVQFDIDVSLNGNHVINCPECGHEHCRVVENGKITEVRWDQRNGMTPTMPSYTTTNLSTSTASTFDSYSGTTGTGYTDSATNAQMNYHLYQSWLNTGTGS